MQIGNIIIGVVLLYIGGWEIVWGEPVNIFTFADDFYFGRDAIAIKVNNAFYGLGLSNRFFDSYFISMVLLGAGLATIFSSSKSGENEE